MEAPGQIKEKKTNRQNQPLNPGDYNSLPIGGMHGKEQKWKVAAENFDKTAKETVAKTTESSYR